MILNLAFIQAQAFIYKMEDDTVTSTSAYKIEWQAYLEPTDDDRRWQHIKPVMRQYYIT